MLREIALILVIIAGKKGIIRVRSQNMELCEKIKHNHLY